MTERSWKFGGGTLTSNIEGFELLRGEKLREAMVAAGLIEPVEKVGDPNHSEIPNSSETPS